MTAALNLYHIKWTEISEIHKITKHISVIFLTDVYAGSSIQGKTDNMSSW